MFITLINFQVKSKHGFLNLLLRVITWNLMIFLIIWLNVNTIVQDLWSLLTTLHHWILHAIRILLVVTKNTWVNPQPSLKTFKSPVLQLLKYVWWWWIISVALFWVICFIWFIDISYWLVLWEITAEILVHTIFFQSLFLVLINLINSWGNVLVWWVYLFWLRVGISFEINV